MKSKVLCKNRLSFITILFYTIFNIFIVLLLVNLWDFDFISMREGKSRRDRNALYKIANGLAAYTREYSHLPLISDDKGLTSVLYPDFVDDFEVFVCKRAVSEYKTQTDDINMSFRFNVMLSGYPVNMLKEEDIIVFEPFWPYFPKETYYIARIGNRLDVIPTKRGVDLIFVPRFSDTTIEQEHDY